VSSKQAVSDVIRTKWLNVRRKRFWAIVLIILYTLLGFFVVPAVIKNVVTGLVEDDLGRAVQVGRIEFNPYTFRLGLQGLEVNDTDQVRLLAFDEFVVNFQLSSLFNWALTFSEVRLDGPYFHFERFETGESRVDHLLADFEKSRPAEPAGEESAGENDGLPRLLIHDLSLNNGHVDVKDNVPDTVVETQLAPINIAIKELNTLPDRHGQQVVSIQLPDNASVSWNGNLTLEPLDSKGELVLEGLQLDPIIAYLESMFPLESLKATMAARFRYHLQQEGVDGFTIAIDDIELGLDDLAVTGLTPTTEFVNISQVSLSGGTFRYPEQDLHFSKLTVEEPRLSTWIKENGDPSALDLVPEPTEKSTASETKEAGAPWQVSLDELVVENGSINFADRSIQPNANIDITDLLVRLTDFNNQDGALIPFDISGNLAQGGSYKLDGNISILPEFSISVSASTRDIPLAIGEPYAQQFVHIKLEGGSLDSDIKMEMPSTKELMLGGSVRIPGLQVLDTVENEQLLRWDMLEIDQFDLNPGALRLSQLDFSQLYGRLVIYEDRSINIAKIAVERASGKAPGDENDAKAMDIIIGGVIVNDSAMYFSDLSLPLPFATNIANLDGTISTIATNSTEPANIRLEGQVEEYGMARIEGSMNLLDPIGHTDVTVDFRNLQMPNMSPYTVQFAGQTIEKGKLDLGLVYRIEEGELNGENDVVLSDLVLGEKIDHPEAGSLPLGLAVGLLKDSDGVIKLNLAVEGDVNSPEFAIGDVIWQALSMVITKIVSAPFKLLGSLIGIDSEDFGQFEFLAGRSDLTPPELEKISQLEAALQQRPELRIEISGVSDAEIDVPAMKFFRLRDVATERLGDSLGDTTDQAMMLDQEIRATVEALFAERFPAIPLDSIKAQYTTPPANDPEGKPVLDQLAYGTELWNRLLEAEIISAADLTNLANARAEVIKTAFLASGQVDENRIVIVASTEVKSDDGEWVKLELGVVSD
jgi:uncharacterized protein involved in outer membrane biogenesis